MHCGMGLTASCRVLRACGVFDRGWPAGQIKQKPSCGYRRSCPKAVSSWVRVPQQLLVHGMLVIQVCTSSCGVCNSTSMGAKKHHVQPIATCHCHCAARNLTAVATAAADVATAAAAVATGRHSICLHHHSQQRRLEPVGITAPPVADGGAARTCGSSVAKFCARQFSGARYRPSSAHRQPDRPTRPDFFCVGMGGVREGVRERRKVRGGHGRG